MRAIGGKSDRRHSYHTLEIFILIFMDLMGGITSLGMWPATSINDPNQSSLDTVVDVTLSRAWLVIFLNSYGLSI